MSVEWNSKYVTEYINQHVIQPVMKMRLLIVSKPARLHHPLHRRDNCMTCYSTFKLCPTGRASMPQAQFALQGSQTCLTSQVT